MKHKIFGYLYLVVVAVLIIGLVYVWEVPKTNEPIINEQSDSVGLNIPVDTSKWKIYNEPKNRFQFLYPADWTYSALPESKSISFAPFDLPSDIYPRSDLVVSVVDGDSESWLKALGEVEFVEKIMVNGYTAIMVTGVPGYIESDTALVYKDNLLVEFTDVGQIHSKDGIFQAIINSIR